MNKSRALYSAGAILISLFLSFNSQTPATAAPSTNEIHTLPKEAATHTKHINPEHNTVSAKPIPASEALIDCPALSANEGDPCTGNNPNTNTDLITINSTYPGNPPPVYCANNIQYPSETINLNTPLLIQVSSCNFLNEYSIFIGINAGYEYEFTGQENTSGNGAYLTVRSDSVDGPVLSSGTSPLTVTAQSNARLYVHYNANENCGEATNCATTTAICLTCATVPDCEGEIGGLALPGTLCDDGDPLTLYERYDANCICEGVAATTGSVCQSAIPIECNAPPTTYSSVNANGINTTFCYLGDNGLWFSFLGTGTDITITSVADFDQAMAVKRAPCDSVTFFNCVDENFSAGDIESYTIPNSVPGEMIFVYIAHWKYKNTTTGNITVSIQCAPQPVCTAPELTLTPQDIDGNPITACLPLGGNYYLNASLAGGSGNDSYNLTANQNTPISLAADASAVLGPFVATTDVTVTAVGNQQDSCSTTATINSPLPCTPVNNFCQDATPIQCGDTIAGSTAIVTPTNSGTGIPACTYSGSGLDIFYSLNVMQGLTYTVSINGDNYSAVLALYSGNCTDLNELYCADENINDGVEESITFTATASETLTIRTYDWNYSGGDFTMAVSCDNLPVFCPDLGAYVGDICNDGNPVTDFDYINESCECTGFSSSNCLFYQYFVADHDPATGISDIYKVDLIDGIASMTYLTTSNIEVHIAYMQVDGILVLVSKHENTYRVYDPLTNYMSPTTSLGADYGEITAATVAPNGKLLFASQDQNAIYVLNVWTSEVSTYDTYAPITGGDLAFTTDGMLYMATRSGNGGLYEVWPEDVMYDQLIGNLPPTVTGLAATFSDQLLVSAQGLTSLELYNTDGSSAATSYPLQLNGQPYTLRDGDLASGCVYSYVIGDCDNPVTFYVNHGPNVNGSDLYTVQFQNENATLTPITNVDFEAHIGFNSSENTIYFVNKDGSNIRLYNYGTGTFIGDLPILGDIDHLTAAEYNPIDGLLYVGDANSDIIATINLSTGIASYYADAPVYGGDLTFQLGSLFLANRLTNQLYAVLPFGESVLIGTIPQGVNGLSLSLNNGHLLASSASLQAFVEINAIDGSTIATYQPFLNGNPFTIANGDMASGCIIPGNEPTPPSNSNLQSQLTAHPNPTAGQSRVTFTTARTSHTRVEVYDINGRNIATLFNQKAEQNTQYQLDFDASYLPNGIYIYRLTTQNETTIEKFMIAR